MEFFKIQENTHNNISILVPHSGALHVDKPAYKNRKLLFLIIYCYLLIFNMTFLGLV